MDRTALLCRNIWERPDITQRELAAAMELSLGTVNGLMQECTERGLIARDGDSRSVTKAGLEYLAPFRADGALLMAAGFGSRFVPLTFETPKGLLEVFGERMIERQIRQLHQAGIRDITIAVGYLKEKFEYLIDRYGVKLLFNPEYSSKNTLSTIWHARSVLKGKNMYILSSDNWMRENMFHTYECGSWYSSVYKEGETSEWCLSFNKKGKITGVQAGGHDSWVMYGPVFLSASFLDAFLPVLDAYYRLPGTEQFYWEQVYLEMLDGTARERILREAGASLSENGTFSLSGLSSVPDLFINRRPAEQVYEFENLEELRQFDTRYRDRSDNEALRLISRVFSVPESDIRHIRCVKAGMTNQSFLFRVGEKTYICRIPGPGTEFLINRREEAASFDAVRPLGISENVIYFDSGSGYKIAEYYEGARCADPRDPKDMSRCMALLRRLHGSGIRVDHRFDIRERIGFYENLCTRYGEIPFEDYPQVREQVNRLLDLLDGLKRPETFSHIDSVADNFLFLPDGQLKLIDLEYSGMCDPLIDIAMCAIYSYYSEEEADRLIEMYLEREPEEEERTVVYAYIALGGFLWSLWAVYKSFVGQEFGEYTIIMYRYAKRYYRKIFK